MSPAVSVGLRSIPSLIPKQPWFGTIAKMLAGEAAIARHAGHIVVLRRCAAGARQYNAFLPYEL